MLNRITIPNPCHESWDEMLPESQGKHCLVCQKTVVDFSGWSPEAISGYLKENAGQKLCGRFKASQLEQAADPAAMDWISRIEQSGMSFIKKIAAVVIIVFGFTASSCEGNGATKGEVHPINDSIDTVPVQTMGIILSPRDTEAICPPKIIQRDTIPDPMIVGELAMPLPQDSLPE